MKLGTITKDDADVFSYDEDESVRDPNLKKHLMHFSIDMDKTEKTEKSTLEMELDLNQKYVFVLSPTNVIQESFKLLVIQFNTPI